LEPVLSLKKSRPLGFCGLLFLYLVFSGFSLSSSKSEGRSFPLPGSFDEVWKATLTTLEAEKIPLVVADKSRGYIESATFPLYKNEYKGWAKAPTFSSSGFCALEIGVVGKDPSLTVVGIKAYFKRKTGLSSSGFRKTDKTKGIFEGLLAKRIHERLIAKNFPKMKSIVLGCNLFYDDAIARYRISEADPGTLAYEQGLRSGDVLLKIDGQEISPGNLFGFFTSVNGEVMRSFTIGRNKEELQFPVAIFYMDPHAPHLGFVADRDPATQKFKVTNVEPGSPAEHAGLLPGDLLLKENDTALESWRNYYRAILAEKEDAPRIFDIERRGRLLQKKIVPEAKPAAV
jgi:membrane-associated protease RseP (regulator of RpoE activity)